MKLICSSKRVYYLNYMLQMLNEVDIRQPSNPVKFTAGLYSEVCALCLKINFNRHVPATCFESFTVLFPSCHFHDLLCVPTTGVEWSRAYLEGIYMFLCKKNLEKKF